MCKTVVCTCMCADARSLDIYRPEEDVSVLLCPSPRSHEAVSLGEPRAKLAASQPSSALSLPPSAAITDSHGHAQHLT